MHTAAIHVTAPPVVLPHERPRCERGRHLLVQVAALAWIGLASACATKAATASPTTRAPASASSQEPEDASGWDAHGETRLLAGDLDAAEQAFHRALALDDRFTAAHEGLAMVRFHRGDAKGGVEALLAGLALVPVDDTTYMRVRLLENLALAQALAGREPEAFATMLASVDAQHLDEATARAVTQVGRARLLLFTEQWARARTEAMAARAGDAPQFVVWVALAIEVRALAGAGDPAAAAAAFAALTDAGGEQHPAFVEATFSLALAQGQLEHASAALQQLEGLDPYAAELARFGLARALREAGREPEALESLQAITRVHRRSVQSAHVRRAAAAELETMRAGASTSAGTTAVTPLHTGGGSTSTGRREAGPWSAHAPVGLRDALRRAGRAALAAAARSARAPRAPA